MFTNGRLLECSWALLSFSLHIVAKLLCFCLCLFNVIVELHAMDNIYIYIYIYMIFSLENESEFSYVIKVHLIRELYLVYVVEAFILLT